MTVVSTAFAFHDSSAEFEEEFGTNRQVTQEFQFVVFNDMIVIWIVPSCLRHGFEPLCKSLPVVVRQQVLVSSSTGTDVTSLIVRMPHFHIARETRRLAMCKVAQVVRFSFPGCAVAATLDISGMALSDTRTAAVTRRVRSASHQSGKRRVGVGEVYHSVHDSLRAGGVHSAA